MATLQGTAIKNTGYLDKVYFNTSIPTEEVIDILEKLTYTSGSYDVCYGTNGVRVNIAKHDSYYSIACAKDGFYDMAFNTDPQYVNEIAGIVSTGWKTSFDNEGFGNPFEIDSDLLSESNGGPIGSQNELLKNLISSTPFEAPALEEFLTGIADSIREVKGTTDKINALAFEDEIRGLKGGSGGSNTPIDNGAIYEGKYRVRYFDADGTILKIEYVESGGKTTPPDNPTYDPDYLIFAEWNYDTDNYIVEQPTDIGAIYDTVDDATYLFCRFTTNTGLTPTLRIIGATSIDWGDGTVDTNVSHTYANEGDYIIKVYGNITFNTSNMTSVTKYLLGSGILNFALQKCYIKNGITNITDHAFYECFSLKNITIPKSVTIIGKYALQYCSNLTNVSIPKEIEISDDAFSYCYGLTNVIIPKSVTSIGKNALRECYSLTSVVIPEGITSISSSTVNSCRSLKNITIPKSVTNIDEYVFYYCIVLTSIVIPEGVTSIGGYAFSGCRSLTNYFIDCDTVPTLSNKNAFNNINASAIMWVNDSIIEQLKVATNWSTYATYMKPLSWYPSLTNPNA
jgi:hypothetical protein